MDEKDTRIYLLIDVRRVSVSKLRIAKHGIHRLEHVWHSQQEKSCLSLHHWNTLESRWVSPRHHRPRGDSFVQCRSFENKIYRFDSRWLLLLRRIFQTVVIIEIDACSFRWLTFVGQWRGVEVRIEITQLIPFRRLIGHVIGIDRWSDFQSMLNVFLDLLGWQSHNFVQLIIFVLSRFKFARSSNDRHCSSSDEIQDDVRFRCVVHHWLDLDFG